MTVRSAYRNGLCRALTVLLLTAGAPALAGDWYVDDDADCSSADGSQIHPFCAIQDAIDVAVDGDRILIAAGTYFEHVVVDRDLALIGEGAEFSIVDGAGSGRPLTVGPRRATEAW